MKDLAPIVLFVYNRLWHTQQTVEALQKNDLATESELYIYADGEKQPNDGGVKKVRKYIKTISGFKKVTIIERDKNWGLADNIVDGVTDIVNKSGRIIVLEDDIVTAKGFLKYMNEALEMYENEEKVMHIASFIPFTKYSFLLPSTFFLPFMSCWGWATWKNRWQKSIWDANYLWSKIISENLLKDFNLGNTLSFHEQLLGNINGTMKTWAIKWYSTIFIKNGLCLYPKYSLSENIGQDGSGINYRFEEKNKLLIKFVDYNKIKLKQNIKENKLARLNLIISYKKNEYILNFLYRKLYYKLYYFKKKLLK